MDRKQITITEEDLEDILSFNDHFEFRFVQNNEIGWIIQQSVTNDYYEILGSLEDGDYILDNKIAKQVFKVKKECVVYE